MIKLAVAALVTYVLALLVAFVVGMIAAIPCYFLWNWIGPAVFHAHALSFWQVWGVLILLHLFALPFATHVKTSTTPD